MDVSKCFQMLDNRRVNKHMEAGKVLEGKRAENNKSLSEPAQFSYGEVTGSLMYLMIGTCPCLVFAAGKLALFSKAPTAAHYNAAKRLLQHIKGTRYMIICFTGSHHLDVCG